jgi:60 kDa SS-A/Ro ribonucleoprotein
MANKKLFSRSVPGPLVPPTNATNEAGGAAYALSAKHALAQFAATGTLNGTFYASAEDQLETTLRLAQTVEPEFLAKTALSTRERSFMKDMPALLAAILSKRSPVLLRRIFDRVINDGKMLRNFVQIVRSGATGRKSLGSGPKKLVQKWLERRTEEEIFKASVGNDPSLADVLKMVHPKPTTPEREAIYGYLIGRTHDVSKLPALVTAFESYKRERKGAPPDVPFAMLTALDLGPAEWTEIARNATWTQTRMNLNTFARHGVFEDESIVELVAKRLEDAEAIKRAKVLPYQLLMSCLATEGTDGVPVKITNALQSALEISLTNVPSIQGRVVVCPDVSGSMASSATGNRKGATSKVRCIDVAALVAAAMLRKNPDAEVLPFEADVVKKLRLNPRDSVLTNARALASIGGGGTNCSAPLADLIARKVEADLVVYVSDNQSWVETVGGRSAAHGTATMQLWASFKARNPRAKLVMIDIQPYATAQVVDRDDVLLVGGFSDQVFELLELFSRGSLNAAHWVGVIEAVELERG